MKKKLECARDLLDTLPRDNEDVKRLKIRQQQLYYDVIKNAGFDGYFYSWTIVGYPAVVERLKLKEKWCLSRGFIPISHPSVSSVTGEDQDTVCRKNDPGRVGQVMHRRPLGGYRSTVSGRQRIDPIVVNVAVEDFEPKPLGWKT